MKWKGSVATFALLLATGCGSPAATEKTVQRDALPEKVSAALDVRFPSAEILKLLEQKAASGTTYEAEMKVEGRRVDAVFASDGTFQQAEAFVGADDLPAPVREDIAKSPQADWTMETIEAITQGDETAPSKYEVVFAKGNEKYEVEYSPDGKRLTGGKAD